MVLAGVWIVVCVLGAVLSVRSIVVLRSRSGWTIAGWAATAVYFVVAGIAAARASHAPAHVDWAALAILTVCFVVAGVRDEPQAEPWWWPVRAGRTGKERREAS
ncbi:MAG: hypothetical protein IAI48_12035 [Candidatus Eremiobacteraeota bacterium]|nr:hypothetical protein [Candidatus Eremiobacteraeota bacterium]